LLTSGTLGRVTSAAKFGNQRIAMFSMDFDLTVDHSSARAAPLFELFR
jgi:hypothetical protein